MKVVVYTKYGPPDVLQLQEMEKPTPKPNEVLVKVYATTVTSGDWRVRSLNVPKGFGFLSRLIFGFSKPRQPILGTELSGEVEAVGAAVTKFKPGDAVFAFCGAKMGCYTEYKCLPETGVLTHKPANVTFAEAAALSFGGTTALDFLRRAKLQKGESILISGASGCVGSAAVQLAKHFGAHVTAVCSGANVALVRSLGADVVIDYTQEDFTQNGQTYDVIMDVIGTAPYSRCKHSLKERGRFLLVAGGLVELLQIPWVSLTSRKKIIGGPAPERLEAIEYLAMLAQKGEYKPVIDRVYPFAQIVDAHRVVDSGRKRGNVVVALPGYEDSVHSQS